MRLESHIRGYYNKERKLVKWRYTHSASLIVNAISSPH